MGEDGVFLSRGGVAAQTQQAKAKLSGFQGRPSRTVTREDAWSHAWLLRLWEFLRVNKWEVLVTIGAMSATEHQRWGTAPSNLQHHGLPLGLPPTLIARHQSGRSVQIITHVTRSAMMSQALHSIQRTML